MGNQSGVLQLPSQALHPLSCRTILLMWKLISISRRTPWTSIGPHLLFKYSEAILRGDKQVRRKDDLGSLPGRDKLEQKLQLSPTFPESWLETLFEAGGGVEPCPLRFDRRSRARKTFARSSRTRPGPTTTTRSRRSSWMTSRWWRHRSDPELGSLKMRRKMKSRKFQGQVMRDFVSHRYSN